MRPFIAIATALSLTLFACDKPKHYTTTLDVLHVQTFGDGGMVELEARYSECPGDARRVMRIEKQHADCLHGIAKGQQHKAELVTAYSADKSAYRSDIVKIDECPIVLDPKEEANFETFQLCSDLKASGAAVGVHCDRRRSDEVIAKCPFLKRR